MKKEDILSVIPLLPTQQFMLTASFRDGQKTYVQQLVFEVRNYERKAIETAVDKLVQSYECLRSIILFEGLKQAVFVSLNNIKPIFSYHQLKEIELEELCENRLEQGFLLDKEAAMKLDWIESESRNFLLITYHHILFDGWGRQKILSEVLFALKFPKAVIQQKFNKNWYEAWKRLNHSSAIEVYKNYLSKFESIASLTTFGKGPNNNVTYSISVSEHQISNAAKSLNLTQAEFVLFGWACFIAKWTNFGKVQLGQIKQNGLIDSCHDGFGLGIQTLPFQINIDFNKTVAETLNDFKERERALSPYPFVDTTNEIFQQISYDFIIAFENYPIESSLGAFQEDFILLKNHDFSEFPLSLAITPKNGELIFDWHFNQKQYSLDQIETVSQHFIGCLGKLPENINSKLNEIAFWEQKQMPQFSLETFLDDFFNKIEKNIRNFGRIELYSYLTNYFQKKEINRIWIIGDKHANSDLLISAALRTKVEVLSLNEKESIAFMQKLNEEHTADLIFTNSPLTLFSQSIPMESIHDLPENPILKVAHKSTAALSICTSGSTGTPKVIQLSLKNLITFFESWEQKIPWKEQEVFATIAHPAFDIGIAELIFPLWKGFITKLITKEILSDTQLLQKELADVTAFHMVPSLLETWIEQTNTDDKSRIIMTGGDKVPPHLQSKLHEKFPNARLFQFYGPSECSVLASGFENTGSFENHLLPLGSRFDHCELFVFANDETQAAAYQEGEIIICGPAVGLGYTNSENTEKFFIYNGQKAYRTGDLGFFDSNGNLFFRGRKDNQIKINGQRIELSRIETALSEWSSIDHWVTVTDGNQLFAFAKSEKPKSKPDSEKLNNWLPFYAIPHFIEYLSEFPLNKNGKVDRKQLLEIGKSMNVNGVEFTLDADFEKILTELFPNKTINSALSWYANGFNSIDALKFSGFLKNRLKLIVEIDKILGIRSLSALNGIKSNISNETINMTIEEGQEIYSTAARILFLSESDDQFFKAYWISSGIVLPKHIDIDEIKNWILKQKNLQLAANAKDNKYLWKNVDAQIFEISVRNKIEFTDFVESKFLNTDSALFISFIGISDKENYIAFKVNHSLLDGLGLELLWKKLKKDLKTGSFSQIKLIAPIEEKIDRNFWKKYLKNVEIKTLPFLRKNSQEKGIKRLNFKLNFKEKEILQQLCIDYNCSLFESGLILYSRLWQHFYGNKVHSVGIPVNIGSFGKEENIAAMSVNILPFRTDYENPEEIIKNWRLIFEKRNTPFSEIARLDKNQKNGLPFFNSTYLYHSQKDGELGFENLDFKRAHSDYGLSLDFIETENELIFSWEFRNDYFSETAISYIQEQLFKEKSIANFKKYPESKLLKSKWEEILGSYSSKTALYFNDKSFSYAELAKLMNNYSENYQKKSEGIEVLLLEREESSIAKLLFHLIEGIPFIPLDAETTTDRVGHIIEMAKNIRISDSANKNLQYVIATSGTTGIPKLVGVSKKGYVSAIDAWTRDYVMNDKDCCMQAASFSFDVSIGDLGRTFFNGSSMLLLNANERKDPMLMLKKVREFSITVFETTPLIARWWLAEAVELKDYASLRLLIIGSDSWKMHEIRTLCKTKKQEQRVISSYGLSETTIDNSFFDPETDDNFEYSDKMLVPIGKEMSHCKLNIVNADSQILKPGIEGFINITGPAVGFGYFVDGLWTNPEATEWKTADRGIVDEWGNFHFKGRSDRQVKIRGQRVELEEIENILSTISHETIWNIVDFEQDFSFEMVAFYNVDFSESQIQELKKKVLSKYPSYYLPTLFIKIDKIPLNINGKTDLNTLRKIAHSKFEQTAELNESNDLIERILNLYQQCFKESANEYQNFFQKGKNSFDAMHFVRSWNKFSNEKMAVHQLFASENFRSLAQILTISQSGDKKQKSLRKISKAQEAIWFEIINGNSTLYNLPHIVEIPESYDLEKLKTAFEKTLKVCLALFVKFEENELGDVFETPINNEDYKISYLLIDKLEQFKEQAFMKEINLNDGPAFEAAILNNLGKHYLYFNPHHLVYDGGSDASLLNILQSFYHDRYESHETYTETFVESPIDWKTYFKLSQKPEIYFRKSDNSIQPGLLLPCSHEMTSKISSLATDYECTATIIISHLLTKALQSSGININWLSLAVDHRNYDCVGMHMRAHPFPGYDSECETDMNIAKQKWALSKLLAAAEQSLIYPDSIAVEAYHQVGLIIQHPFFLENIEIRERMELSRPRLPLSLYVENINNQLFFRWEFDNSQISIEKIREIHQEFFNLAHELSLKNKKIVKFNPVTKQETNSSKSENFSPELKQIWAKYTGHEKVKSLHFFESGANSIKALLMLKEIEKRIKVRISAADFFRQPTLNFLSKELVNNENKDLVWQINDGNSKEELWLLPPIMGFGFIFNSLNLPKNLRTYTFNYPAAMGHGNCENIEEIAKILLKERVSLADLPEEITLLGYSMGALTAFEMAKWLEENNVKVKRLIVLDKIAQPEVGRVLQKADLNGELMNIAKQIAVDETDFNRIINYLSSHESMIEAYHQMGFIQCPIEVFYCEKGFSHSDFLKWQRFSSNKISLKPIPDASHYEIPKIWNVLNIEF
jgi:non-ribosomal peptide synthetase component F/surfactin synthase thioesterase subunit